MERIIIRDKLGLDKVKVINHKNDDLNKNIIKSFFSKTKCFDIFQDYNHTGANKSD